MLFTRRFLLAFLGLSNLWNLQAFLHPHSSSTVPRKVLFFPTRRSQTTALQAEKKNHVAIVFACDLTFACDPLPGNTKVEDMAEFLVSEECRRLLMSAGGTRAVEKLQVTPDLQGMWTEACDGFVVNDSSSSPSLPKEPEEFMSADAVIPFPGITVTNTVVNGVTRMEDEKEKGGLPKYLFLLVGEKRSVQGPKPLVWLYNKMTGGVDGDEDKDTACYSKPQGSAFTYSSILVDKDGAPAFNVDVRLRIVLEFPKYVMRLLPASKEKMEEQGSNACARAVSKDVELAVRNVREAFLTWHRNSVPLQ